MVKDLIVRSIIVVLGLAPVSCHYAVTGPALWAHQTSYAFEAWLLMWIGGIFLAGLSLYIATRPNEPDA
jgi:hypothetical protein